MGGRGSAYYEENTAEIERLLRKLEQVKERKLYNNKWKEDPITNRNSSLTAKMNNYGISTRRSTDKSSREHLAIHQKHILLLSKKYANVIDEIPNQKNKVPEVFETSETEFSKNYRTKAFGYLSRVQFQNGAISTRLSLSSTVIDYPQRYVALKTRAINSGWSAPVDEKNIHLHTTTHEFGHYVEENLFFKLNKNIKEEERTYYATKIQNEVIKICQQKYKHDIIEKDIFVSNYAKENFDPFEWFAETFTNLELSKNPKMIALALNDYIGGFK